MHFVVQNFQSKRVFAFQRAVQTAFYGLKKIIQKIIHSKNTLFKSNPIKFEFKLELTNQMFSIRSIDVEPLEKWVPIVFFTAATC